MTQPDRFIKVPEAIARDLFQSYRAQSEQFQADNQTLRDLGAEVLVRDFMACAQAVGLRLNPGVSVPRGFRIHPRRPSGDVVPNKRVSQGKKYAALLAALTPPSLDRELHKRGYPTYHWTPQHALQHLECLKVEAENLIVLRLPAGCKPVVGEKLSYEAFYALIEQHTTATQVSSTEQTQTDAAHLATPSAQVQAQQQA